MKIALKICGILLLLLFGLHSFCQDYNLGFGGLKMLKSGDPESVVYEIAIGPLSDFQVNAQLPYSLNDVFTKNAGDPNYTLNFSNLARRSTPRNNFHLGLQSTLFYFAAHFERSAFSFKIEENFQAALGMEKSMMQFLNRGNKTYLGEQIHFGIPASQLHYRSYDLRWFKQLNDEWELGLTASFYSGKSTLSLTSELSLFTQESLDYIDLKLSGSGQMVMPLILSENESGFVDGFQTNFTLSEYLLGGNNPGVGMDILVNYNPNDRLSLMATINDLGVFFWNKGARQFSLDASLEWKGIDVSNFVYTQQGGIDSTGLPNLQKLFQSESLRSKSNSMVKGAPASITAGAQYQLSYKLDLGVYNQVQFFDHFIRELFMLTGRVNMNETIFFTAGLAYANPNYLFMPIGVEINKKHFSLNMALSNAWGIISPSGNRNFGGSLGIKYRFEVQRKESKKGKKKAAYSIDERYPFYERRERERINGRIF